MKQFLRSLSLLLALLFLVTALATTLVACNGDSTGDGGTEDDGGNNGGNGGGNGGGQTGGKTQYTVSLKNIGGRALGGITFYVYEGEDLKAYGETDANGIGTVDLPAGGDYKVEIPTKSLAGYNVQARYPFTGNSAMITLTSSVIENTKNSFSGITYSLGDIIHNFRVTDIDGNVFDLAETLKTKNGVLINFFYNGCSPCNAEAPYMQSTYEMYKDEIAVIAINDYPTEDEYDCMDFRDTHGLTFPVVRNTQLGLYAAFRDAIQSTYGQTGYPTSIFVDRYGAICLIELGGLTSEKPFVAAYEHFTSDNYVQKLFTSISELTPTEKPNKTQPSSDEIGAFLNGTNGDGSSFSAIYTPETESSDAEYSWPFITGELEDGTKVVYPSNSFKDNSFATMHASVTMKAGQALAVDWFADTEISVDILYILVDGRDVRMISGTSREWETVYPFVAEEDGTYRVSFIYVKDSGIDTQTDRVLFKNMRLLDVEDISTATYIPRRAATKPNANGLGYGAYITPVFNEVDGYYHVGSVSGPILLVNLMGSTLLSKTSLNDLGYNGRLRDAQGDVYEVLVDYCNYAINGLLYGFCPVTAELRALLERAAELVGFEPGNPDQWLQACEYYDAYGTDEPFADPVKGVAFFAAFDTVESTGDEDAFNTVEYDGRVLMPRGLKYKFVPTKSGAYIIKSQSQYEVNGWIFNDRYQIIQEAAVVDRPYGGQILDTTNVSMIIYMEAGKTYYIDIAYYDVYGAGTFTFTVRYLGETYEQFHLASPGYFTYNESTTGEVNETIAGGIDVILGADGYYHELRADGSIGSIIYADYILPTGLFSHSVKAMILMGGFNFSFSDYDQIILTILTSLDGDVDACRAYFREQWGEDYESWSAEYKLEEVLAGTYHGGLPITRELTGYCTQVQRKYAELSKDADATRAYFETLWGDSMGFAKSYALDLVLSGEYDGNFDFTAFAQEYFEAHLINESPDAPELVGCVAVDETVAALLQAIVDKYSFSGVDHAWTKLCYYYKLLG